MGTPDSASTRLSHSITQHSASAPILHPHHPCPYRYGGNGRYWRLRHPRFVGTGVRMLGGVGACAVLVPFTMMGVIPMCALTDYIVPSFQAPLAIQIYHLERILVSILALSWLIVCLYLLRLPTWLITYGSCLVRCWVNQPTLSSSKNYRAFCALCAR
jgi:hypothetical protein